MDFRDALADKKIAVIGLGYVGSQLINLLKKIRQDSDFEIFEINRKNLDLLAAEEFDYVFNCAGNTGDFRRQPIKTVESNVGLNVFILENCRIRESLVALSSTRIYGFSSDKETIFSENDFALQDHLKLESIYDNAKKLMECLLLNTPRDYRKIVIRLSNVFGKYEAADLDDSTFLKLMLRHRYENKPLDVRQNLESSKDYVFIEDALDGILRGGILSKTDDVFNICSGKSYSIKDWAEFLNLTVRQIGEPQPTHSSVSNAKAEKLLDFAAQNTLEKLSIPNVIKYE